MSDEEKSLMRLTPEGSAAEADNRSIVTDVDLKIDCF
jgi:hypothetical protein